MAFGDLVVTLGLNAAPFASGLAGASNRLQSFSAGVTRSMGAIRGALGVLAPIGAGIGAVLGFSSAISGARDAAAQQNKLQAVLKATGGAAGLTAGEISQMADSLASMTNFEDDATIGAAGVLATFKAIKGDTFREAMGAAQDLSAVMGQDLQSSVVQIGKALNDPTKGFAALRRAGVSFTESQIQQIKTLQQSGDMLGAQGVILGELKSEFGGAAQAMADPLVRLQNVVGNVGETIGGLLLPTINALANGFMDAVGPLAGGGDVFSSIGSKIGAMVETYLKPFFAIAKTGIGWLVSGFGLLSPAFDLFAVGLQNQQQVIGTVLGPLVDGISWVVNSSLPLLTAGFDKTVEYFMLLGASLDAGLRPIFDGIAAGFMAIFSPIYDAISQAVSDWLPTLSSCFETSTQFIDDTIGTIAFAFRNMSQLSQIAVIDLLTFIIDNLPGSEDAFVELGATIVGTFSGVLAFTKSFVQNVVAGFQEIGNFAKAIFAGVAQAFSAMLSGENPLTAFQDSMTKTLASQKDVQGGGNPFEKFQSEFLKQREATIGNLSADGGLKNQLAGQREKLLGQIAVNENKFVVPSLSAPELKPPTPGVTPPQLKAPEAGGGVAKSVKVEALQAGSKEAYSAIQSFIQGGREDAAKQQLAETQRTADAAEDTAAAVGDLVGLMRDQQNGFGAGGGDI